MDTFIIHVAGIGLVAAFSLRIGLRYGVMVGLKYYRLGIDQLLEWMEPEDRERFKALMLKRDAEIRAAQSVRIRKVPRPD